MVLPVGGPSRFAQTTDSMTGSDCSIPVISAISNNSKNIMVAISPAEPLSDYLLNMVAK